MQALNWALRAGCIAWCLRETFTLQQTAVVGRGVQGEHQRRPTC
jgi:hypothetical protein